MCKEIIVRKFAEWAAYSATRSGYPAPKRRADVYPLIRTPQYAVLFEAERGRIEAAQFDEWHGTSCLAIINHEPELPYGWAVKLINVYLKTSAYIANQGRANLLECLHPPIDGGLWQGIEDRFHSRRDILDHTHRVTRIKEITNAEIYLDIISGCRVAARELGCSLFEVEQLWRGTEF